MPTSRKILVASAVALACHFVALAFHSALGQRIIEFALLLLATAACFEAASRAEGFARRFWRLMGVAFALYAAGQVISDLLRQCASCLAAGVVASDIFFLYHYAPMAMALFLAEDSAESRVYRCSAGLILYKLELSRSPRTLFLYLPLRSVRRPEDINACIGGFLPRAISFWR